MNAGIFLLFLGAVLAWGIHFPLRRVLEARLRAAWNVQRPRPLVAREQADSGQAKGAWKHPAVRYGIFLLAIGLAWYASHQLESRFAWSPDAWKMLRAMIWMACGLWLLLPRGNIRARTFGGIVLVIAMLEVSALLPATLTASNLVNSLWWATVGFSLVAAGGTVTSRRPSTSLAWLAVLALGIVFCGALAGAAWIFLPVWPLYGMAIGWFAWTALAEDRELQTAFYNRLSWEAPFAAVLVSGLLVVGTWALRDGSRMPQADDTMEPTNQEFVSALPVQPPDDQEVGAEWRHVGSVGIMAALVIATVCGTQAIPEIQAGQSASEPNAPE